MSWSLRSMSASEGLPNRDPFRVTAPTAEQYRKMFDRLVHGEDLFTAVYPELKEDVDWASLMEEFKDSASRFINLPDAFPERRIRTSTGELLAGPLLAIRDLQVLRNYNLWHERDLRYVDQICISDSGCWELPAYIDHKQPKRARYPQVRTYSTEHEDIRQQMGPAWMWQRILSDLPPDKLPSGKRMFWPDHRCLNKNCVYPRHLALGTPYANDAQTQRVEHMQTYSEWKTKQWARPSFAYPEGLQNIVHESEVFVLSDRSVILPVRMSKCELEATFSALKGKDTLPRGRFTTDPGYHVFKGAMTKGFDFDEKTGCWNARVDLDSISPHIRTIIHMCGNQNCCNIRHMDISDTQRMYYEVVDSDYVTLPDGRIVHTLTGEILPPYWESWRLFWEWLRPRSQYDLDYESPHDKEYILGFVDFSHLWVHPLTGCWENESFYPRWSANGAQQNAYGFHRKRYAELGRSTHRYLYMKYMEQRYGVDTDELLDKDVDHCCNNRRCCNPLHMQDISRREHMRLTFDRRGVNEGIAKVVNQRQRLRRLGRKR